MEKIKFRFSVGQQVWWRYEWYTIEQRRVSYGRPAYRLENGSVVLESLLK